MWGCVYLCVCMTHEGSRGSALICFIVPLLTEKTNIYMNNVFVFLLFFSNRLKERKDAENIKM